MLKTKIAIALAVTGATTFLIYLGIIGSEEELEKRFPEIDPKIVKKVHREMLIETLTGQYGNSPTDAQLDEIFYMKIWQLLPS